MGFLYFIESFGKQLKETEPIKKKKKRHHVPSEITQKGSQLKGHFKKVRKLKLFRPKNLQFSS